MTELTAQELKDFLHDTFDTAVEYTQEGRQGKTIRTYQSAALKAANALRKAGLTAEEKNKIISGLSVIFTQAAKLGKSGSTTKEQAGYKKLATKTAVLLLKFDA